MSRQINIFKENGNTTVTIRENGDINKVVYTGNANIHLMDTFILVVDKGVPFLKFVFSEIENPYTASNLTEYYQVMLDNKFFANETAVNQQGGGGLPIDHTHTIAEVQGLQTALNNKADVNHTHTIPQVTGLQTALNGKSDTNHTHVINWDDIQNKPSLSVGQHTHVIADVTNLQQALNNKADIDHTHTFNWSNLDTLFELRNIKFVLSNADKSKYIICNGNNMSVTINANDLNNNFECIIDNPHRHIVTIPVNGNVLGSTYGLTQPYTLAKGGSVYIYKFNNQLYIIGRCYLKDTKECL